MVGDHRRQPAVGSARHGRARRDRHARKVWGETRIRFNGQRLQADKTLAAVKDAVTAAQANLAEHRLLGRRPAQQQLTAAEQNLAATQAVVDRATATRQPFLQAAFGAKRRCEAITQHPDTEAFNVLADAIRTRTPELVVAREQTRAIEENPLDLGIGR